MNRILTNIIASIRALLEALKKGPQDPAIPFDGKIYTLEVTDSVTDMQEILSQYTGHKFETVTRNAENGNGIYLIKEELGERTGQSFYLKKDRLNKAVLKYTIDTSLDNAIYTFLHLLGFRWYGPGENWFYTPAKLNQLSIKQFIEPSFRNRDFSPSGGVSYFPPYDATNSFLSDWQLWRKRNRYSNDFPAQSHAGQRFYNENKALLDRPEHRGWSCSDRGRTLGRIKIEVPEAVEAYKNWAKGLYDVNKTFNNIGVDPADGAGGSDDCLPAGMDIENYSEKWFWLANEVTKEFDLSDQRTVVSMYAYGNGNTAGKVPRFPLRANLYVYVVPYAFQRTYLPKEMIREWSNVVDRMAIYDYWNITQWSKGLPQFSIHTIPTKINFWKTHKVDGILCESTWSAGPMGHAHWLAGQLEFDITNNFDSLYSEYLTNYFGAGANDMRRMFDRWSLRPQGSAEVSFSLLDLKAALAKVMPGGIEYKRILELAAYVHFMRLYYDQKTIEDFNRTIQYLDSIHHLRMVQTAAMRQQNYLRPADWEKNPDYNIVQASYESILGQFKQDLAERPVKYSLIDFNFDITKASVIPGQPAPEFWYGKSIQYYVEPKASGTITIQVGTTAKEEAKGTVVRIYTHDNDELLVNEKIFEGNYDQQLQDPPRSRTYYSKNISFQVEQGNRYIISVGFAHYINFISMRFPGHELFFKTFGLQDHDNSGYPMHYFYVPKAATEIIFEDPHPAGLNGRGYLSPLGGERVQREIIDKNIHKVPVAEEFRGKIWTADFGHPSYKLLNIENVGSLVPFNYSE